MQGNIYQPLESEYLYREHPQFSTKAIHAGQKPDSVHGSVNTPIHLSTTYAQHTPGNLYSEYDYTRCGNPTRSSLESCIAALEHGKYTITYSSGCAAMVAILNTLEKGAHVIVCDDVYGGTQRYLRQISQKNHGLDVTFIDMTNIENVRAAIKPEQTKLMWIETPTNPTLKLIDIEAVCVIAKENKILTVVDNTFATPYLQTPLELGADYSVNSGTKYLGGHSDVVFGTVTVRSEDLHNSLFFSSKSTGGCPSIFDCYLVLRSLKTLELRVKAHVRNAYIIARHLEKHPLCDKVIYPGLESHPQHELAKRQMRGYGGMLSFYIKGGKLEMEEFFRSVKIFTLAESLGGVESLIECPALMTHFSVPPEIRNELGITDNLIRVSVGIENVEDLIADLNNALEKSQVKK